ncbi:TPA: hypothetical protein HA225_00715 [Candidatus Micrarchaeota archaeon]|nr:hypothetical protein [Candidatus Micrarchaeota archaeon]HIH30768.1 hypothetical protein [Candidatus Micrarchaeota archaeon]
MDVGSRKTLSVTQPIASVISPIEKFQNIKKDTFLYKYPFTSLDPKKNNLSPIDEEKRKIGALNTELKDLTYAKKSTHNDRVTVLKDEELLAYPLEHISPRDKWTFKSGGRLYAFHRVAATVAEDGSPIDPETRADNALEHSPTISQYASRPVAYVKTRQGDVFLVTTVSGETAMGALEGEELEVFDLSSMDSGKKQALGDAYVDFLGNLILSGNTVGGVSPQGIQYKDGKIKALNPLRLSSTDEDSSVKETCEIIATLSALCGGSTAEVKSTIERLSKKLYEEHIGAREAMTKKFGPNKPYKKIAEKAVLYGQVW